MDAIRDEIERNWLAALEVGSLHLELITWDKSLQDSLLEAFTNCRGMVDKILGLLECISTHPFPNQLENRLPKYDAFLWAEEFFFRKCQLIQVAESFRQFEHSILGPTRASSPQKTPSSWVPQTS